MGERDELRAQGLLGSKNGKVDMKQKYKEGMGIHAVKEEIKAFLMGGNTTLSLPPMGKADRKVIHELANAFYLKSKSAGNGDNRFPIPTELPGLWPSTTVTSPRSMQESLADISHEWMSAAREAGEQSVLLVPVASIALLSVIGMAISLVDRLLSLVLT